VTQCLVRLKNAVPDTQDHQRPPLDWTLSTRTPNNRSQRRRGRPLSETPRPFRHICATRAQRRDRPYCRICASCEPDGSPSGRSCFPKRHRSNARLPNRSITYIDTYGLARRVRAGTPVTGGSTCLWGPALAGQETPRKRLAVEPLEPATRGNDTRSRLRVRTR
jgi:hypothetical protein